MIEFTARGTTFSGSAVSPAATPTSSRAAYAKITPCMTRTTGIRPCGRTPAVVGDHAQAGCPTAHFVPGGQQEDADQHETDEGGDLDDREPELHLAEVLHRDQVHRQDHREGDQGQRPLRDVGEQAPVVRVEGDRGDVGDAGRRPVEEVHPPGDVGALLAEELPRVRHEGTGRRAVEDQLAEGPDDEEGEDAADEVGECERRARVVQAAAGSQEESGADRAADGDHVDVTGLEVLAVAGVARVHGRRGRPGAGAGLCRFHGVLAHGWFHSLVRPGGSRSGVRT